MLQLSCKKEKNARETHEGCWESSFGPVRNHWVHFSPGGAVVLRVYELDKKMVFGAVDLVCS
jgi:hypothetical protein